MSLRGDPIQRWSKKLAIAIDKCIQLSRHFGESLKQKEEDLFVSFLSVLVNDLGC